jgi:dTDP-4-amino-4,6-dideoxygalactose transaminase
MLPSIPFNKPCLTGNELSYIERAIANGHSASGGPFSARAVELLIQLQRARDVLLTTSCTDALEMSAMLVGVRPGDVVIVPSFTFTSTALAFARAGAQLRFCDIERSTLGVDPDHLETLLDEQVRAVVIVHYAGVPCDLDAIVPMCERAGVPLIEDNAHGFLATHRGRPLGSFGRLSTLSFHETKNFICGEGGALIVNEDRDVAESHVLLDKGTNRKAFMDGLVDKYTWQGLGSSFGLSDLLAAFLTAQIESVDQVRAARRRVSTTYRSLLSPLSADLEIELPGEPETATPADHMFYVLLPSSVDRGALIGAMRERGVSPTFHYVPLHSAPAGRRFADRHEPCPVTDDISARLVRLPFYNDLSTDDIERVVDTFVRAMDSARK